MMTATKAVAGGIAANIVTIALWLITMIPGWDTIPTEPKAAIIALVSTAIGAGVVYFAPPNRPVGTASDPFTRLDESLPLR